MPAQAILSELDRPLLCSSAHVVEHDELEIPEAAVLMDQFVGQGLDFIVDAGHEQRVSLFWLWHHASIRHRFS